jgi:transporter family protein
LWCFVTREQRALGSIDRRDAVFIVASGFATGASWLCFYHALQNGPASLVVPIDKLSIVVTVAFATIVLHERLSRRAAVGLVLIVGGTLLMLV